MSEPSESSNPSENCFLRTSPWVNPKQSDLAMRKEESASLVGCIIAATGWNPTMAMSWIVKFAYVCAMKDHVVANAMMDTYKAHLKSDYDPLARPRIGDGWYANYRNN